MKRYTVIYADPPWRYKNYGRKNAPRGCEKEYDTMSPEDIMRLPVKELAAENCVLFLWATFPLLPEALEVMRAWGFEYKTLGFVWVKTNKKTGTPFWGMGNWTRSNPEVCLIGVRGKPKRVSNRVHSVVLSPRREHSRKPDEVRDRITQLMGDVPRIELFARQKTAGWTVWGNETGKFSL